MRPYRASEAAAMISISRTWLVTQARAGRIPGAHRTQQGSGHWRFERGAWDKYVADLRAGVKPRAPKSFRPLKNKDHASWLAGWKE